ncbi:MAG: MFS transporter, partial [Acidobacteria bacterium]|nr:MFS transporter [Acidobacteriota bacterium]
RRVLGLEPGVAALAAGLFVFGIGQELWWRYLPAYLRALGASALAVGAFGTLTDFLDAAYAYPGGVFSDRVGSRRALLAFGVLTTSGFVVYLIWSSAAGIFIGLFLVMAWKSLGLPATFAIIGEELAGARRTVAFTVQAILKRLPIVVAPPLGGMLIERFGMAKGMRAGFAISIALAAAMLIGLRIGFRRPLPAGVGDSPAAAEPGRAPFHPVLRRLLAADCLVRLCEGLPDVFLVIWALEIVRISPARFGLLVSIQMLTAIVSYLPGAVLAGRVEKKPFVVLTFFFFALFPFTVVVSRSFWHLAAAYVVAGLREIGEPARKALIVQLSPAQTRGRSVGAYYAARGFVVAGAAAVGGALWTIRPSLTFFAAGFLGLAGTAWAAAFLPAHPERELKAHS